MRSWQSEKARNVIEMLNKKIGFNEDRIPVTPLHELTVDTVNHGDTYCLSPECDIEVIQTPGHSVDQIAFYYKPRKRLFVGDALGELGDFNKTSTHTDIGEWRPLMFDNVSQYLESLTVLSKLSISQIVLGHSGIVEGENLGQVIDGVRYQAIQFIKEMKREMACSSEEEALANKLTKQWEKKSSRFVPHSLHLNSMRFMLREIHKFELKTLN